MNRPGDPACRSGLVVTSVLVSSTHLPRGEMGGSDADACTLRYPSPEVTDGDIRYFGPGPADW